jgi:hypothetical protein
LQSVNGLATVELIGSNGVIDKKTLNGEQQSVSFKVPNVDGWLSLVVVDSKENSAFSNPIWVKMIDKSKF